MTSLLTLLYQEAPVTVSCKTDPEGLCITLGDEGNQVSVVHVPITPGHGMFTWNNRQYPYHVVQADEKLYVWVAGRTVTFDLASQGPVRRSGSGAAADGAGDLKAPMPGKVLQIKAASGHQVAADTPIIIMESMKMEMTLSSPVDVTVTAIHCEKDEMVDMGAVLASLEAVE
ncbi:MAG: hypothetical protein KTR14_00935 [Vampirovibrio sp.]|nr:hypothetical protein [Vampirovibrio sp.]